MASTLPESTTVPVLLRRYSTDPQLEEAAEKLTNCARTFKQYLAAIIGQCADEIDFHVESTPSPSRSGLFCHNRFLISIKITFAYCRGWAGNGVSRPKLLPKLIPI